MVMVKMLKPYYVKVDERFIRVILAYQYFSVTVNGDIYQYVPVNAKEIRINRHTQKVDNVDATFTFQRGKKIIHISMTRLMGLPDFIKLLDKIIEPYYQEKSGLEMEPSDIENIIQELEIQNVYRLIDKALDDDDEETFYALTGFL